MGKDLQKEFKSFVKDVLQYLTPQRESDSEVSRLIPEPRKFAEFTKLSDDIKTLG